MGAWIEMKGTCSLKSIISRRTPRWVRGLKSVSSVPVTAFSPSHPTMGAWIEIQH